MKLRNFPQVKLPLCCSCNTLPPCNRWRYARFVNYALLRPLLFRLDAETAHGLAFRALRLQNPKAEIRYDGPLACTVAGLQFPNPVGMAAGFDKNAEAPDAILGMGFGYAEVGSVTPRPQAGNVRPRLFRLVEDRAVINRMGFNNHGGDAAAARLKARAGRPGVIGMNIGANKDSEDRVADYTHLVRLMAPLCSYIVVNVSSPNTPGLRALQDESALTSLLDAVIAERDATCGQGSGPRSSSRSPPISNRQTSIRSRASPSTRHWGR